ncbi:uncharacterized protein GVI51_I03509 [Nakaseomyces glabratus]|uniref:Cardiolipin synthase (CMP-forming) n=2 Tax=Candida glabrata TaxID=5478 RepID=Q6FQT1_CANGA|nr:uncharacterized protein CAGL0I03784g [Nakaseomyces glabratus]KAH7580685.1 CDP-alcohol phosphatidyltransferase [Nakaseomyces glabratus]KAH7585722.1 CDP-alcohol phosphatidyltransferase [Nakaseomyces glabratus]KAH7587411.1 CDP-alcohol phosphatidyltransferase [Nakaseomyces glabratus]KAH7599354.1 CDP-alcohol phosphatidyltransferase [Nakaseomyces glabratus]KAH7599668.1 CDP-alcohol phosphatidyltransferase [Nakaseomyces glabratus]|eukprot:XP_447413.1 uncharacterized protein CAGL0I03784g [[Candida] glabrata]
MSIPMLPAILSKNVGLRSIRCVRGGYLRVVLGASIGMRPYSDLKVNKKDFLTIPNVITITRIATTPMIGYFLLNNQLVPALSLFAYSSITDFLDGYIARRYNMKSDAGTILDPMADKLLMIITTAALALPPGPQVIPIGIASLILGRDILMGFSAIFIRYASLKQKYHFVTWKSFWDFFKYPSAVVKPLTISKWNTFLQMIYLGLAVFIMILDQYDTKVQEANEQKDTTLDINTLKTGFSWLGYIVGATTVISGTSYVFSKSAVTFIKKI